MKIIIKSCNNYNKGYNQNYESWHYTLLNLYNNWLYINIYCPSHASFLQTFLKKI